MQNKLERETQIANNLIQVWDLKKSQENNISLNPDFWNEVMKRREGKEE